MSWRTVVISTRSKLDLKLGYLVIRSDDVGRIFLDEIAVLVIENPAVSLTGCLIEALTEKKIKVIFCDSKRSPTAELVPYYGSHDSSRKIRIQTGWKEVNKGAVWTAIVLDYMELVREFGRDKLFIFVNMRSFYSQNYMELFSETVIKKELKVLLVDNFAYQLIKNEKRVVIDNDLCEIYIE